MPSGGKIKKKDKQEVVIEKVIRNKQICFTTVKAWSYLLGVKLCNKKLGNKFPTGAYVVKGLTEKEQINVQRDITFDVVEFITDTWPDVPETAIFFIDRDGKKVPAA